MIQEIIAKVKGLLISPRETFQASRDDTPGTVFTYFAALLVIDALLTSAITALGIGVLGMFGQYIPPFGPFLPVIVFVIVLIGGFIWALIVSAWIHLWVYLAGGRKGIFRTIKAILYGMTPGLLLGWIPFFGIIFSLWAFALEILGIQELQEISLGKAILVLVIAVILPLILILLLALYLWVNAGVIHSVPVAPTNIL
jgi:hypothetical protein